jgi:hypothetical protein
MDTYSVEIEGSSTLEDVNHAVRGEEAAATEFLDSTISLSNGKITNIAKFKKLPAGTIPKSAIFVEHNDARPQGTKRIWTGVMVINGTNTGVSAYRA